MIEVRTPSRLHFGLLAYGDAPRRQFGGLGLMVRHPNVLIRVRQQPLGRQFTGDGPMADRAITFAKRFAMRAVAVGLIDHVPPVHIRVARVPRPHTGLGSGTQLGMAVARALAALIDRGDLGAAALAGLVGRGRRSAVGAHGSITGGLIIEGGKAEATQLAPLIARLDFPDPWRIVLIRPEQLDGLAGQRELRAFADLPPIPAELSARMCQLTLLGLAPAMVERQLDEFGWALFELQQLAGECFKTAQGGVYAHPLLARVVDFIRKQKITGVGQSSWGPTLYAITGDDESAERLAGAVQNQFGFGPGEVRVTQADNKGCVVRAPATSAYPTFRRDST